MTSHRTLNRMLEKTPAETLAALSASAFIRGDTAESERIFAALPGHGRASRHEYLIQHHALTESALLWVIECLKAQSTINACLAASLAADSDHYESIAVFLGNAHKAKLTSLIEAMREVCKKTGVSFEDIIEFAEIEQPPEAKPIPKLVAKYVAMFGVTIQP